MSQLIKKSNKKVYCILALLFIGISFFVFLISSKKILVISQTVQAQENPEFSFAVFGDLQASECNDNEYIIKQINAMAQSEADFFINTGDLIAGYTQASCFAHNGSCAVSGKTGSVKDNFSPILSKTPPSGLKASFFPVIGNHDDGWGSSWYPDPCGDGICDFIDPTLYINHGDYLNEPGFFNHSLNHGDICNKASSSASGHSEDFYYSFVYKKSYFIILRQNQDYSGMLSCNNLPGGYSSCSDYCSDESLFLDSQRNSRCYNVYQYDWLVSELKKASASYEHIFVFSHAPFLTSSWNHAATAGAGKLRELLEKYNVEIHFSGHNHAYERTVPVKNGVEDSDGVVYITTGPAGAKTDGINGAWFTAASYKNWASYNDQGGQSGYVLITVKSDGTIEGARYGITNNLQDDFILGASTPTPPPPTVCESDGLIHVAVDGSDSIGNGYPCKPYQTIQKGVDIAKPGDTVYAHKGTYLLNDRIYINKIGTSKDKKITLLGEDGVIINAANIPNGVGYNDAVFIENSNYITIDNFVIKNAPRCGLRCSVSDYITIKNSVFADNGMTGLFTDFCDYLLIENNQAYGSKEEHGIYISNSSDYPVLRNNVAYNNKKAGIQINADPVSSEANCIWVGVSWGDPQCDGITTNALVENNVFYGNEGFSINLASVRDSTFQNNLIYNSSGGGIAAWGDGNGPSWGSKNNIFANNLIYMKPGEGRSALKLTEGSTDNTVINNILMAGKIITYNYGAFEFDDTSSKQKLMDYNIFYRNGQDVIIAKEDEEEYTLGQWQKLSGYDEHSFVVSQPADLFIDYLKENFQPKTSSLSIDRGTGENAPSYDLEGNKRPQGAGFDIGPYESLKIIPAISFSKQVDKNQAQAGDILTYTLTYQNTSSVEAKNIIITDEIPEGATYIEGGATNGGTYNSLSNKVTWTIPSLEANDSKDISFKVQVGEKPAPVETGIEKLEIKATLHPSLSVSPSTPTTVSFGMLFPKDFLTDLNFIRIKDNKGNEIPAHIREIVPWRNLMTGDDLSSIRSALIQVNINFNDNSTPVDIIIETGVLRTKNITAEVPVKDSWVLVDDDKYPASYGVYEPSVYVSLPPDWLGKCAIKTQTVPFGTYGEFDWYDNSLSNNNPNINDGQNFFKTMINDDARVTEENDIDYLNTGEYEPWLFDRAMTMYTIYIRSGNAEVLKEAHRAAYFYSKHIKDNGFFDLKTGDDLKYSYGEGLLTDLMLIGDESHIDKIKNVAKAANAFNYVFNPEADHGLWTERHLAFAWLAYITAFEATGNSVYSVKSKDIADYIFTHQNNPPSNVAHGQSPNDGALMHSFELHEGWWNDQRPYWIFSPWMTTLLVDAMQRYYQHSGDTRVIASAKRFGDAIINVANKDRTYGYELGGTIRVPSYLAGSNGSYEEYDDYNHTFDVAKITAFAYHCSVLEGSPVQKYLDETNKLLSAAEYLFSYWIRPAAPDYGKSIYRLSPPRKGNWWFRTTSDLDWLLHYKK